MARDQNSGLWPGVPLVLGSAVLFGAAAPFSKLLLGMVDPQMLAGLLYLGAGLGLVVVHAARAGIGVRAPEAPLRSHDLPWLIIVIVFGGILGSLLLDFEGLATMAIAWLGFARTWTGGFSLEHLRSSAAR